MSRYSCTQISLVVPGYMYFTLGKNSGVRGEGKGQQEEGKGWVGRVEGGGGGVRVCRQKGKRKKGGADN